MGRPKKDKDGDENSTKRVYIALECYWRVKMFAANHGLGQQESFDAIINNTINEKGELFKSQINLEDDVSEELVTLAAKFDMPQNELIRWMTETIKVLFDDKLRFVDAIKSIPELKKEVESTGNQRQITK